MGSGEYCYMTLLTRHKTKDSPYFQIKIIILRGVKFPEGGAAAPVAPPLYTPLVLFAYGSAKTYFVNNLRTAKYFLKHAGLPKRVWQGHKTSVGREDLLVTIMIVKVIFTDI